MTREVTDADLPHLRRCVELAAEAVEAAIFRSAPCSSPRMEPFSPRTGTGR